MVDDSIRGDRAGGGGMPEGRARYLPGAVRLGRRLYFIRAELLAYVEQGRVSRSGETGGGT